MVPVRAQIPVAPPHRMFERNIWTRAEWTQFNNNTTSTRYDKLFGISKMKTYSTAQVLCQNLEP